MKKYKLLIETAESKKTKRRAYQAEDYIGKRPWRLKILKQSTVSKHYVECECTCGNLITTRLRAVVTGCSKSCGCLTREVATMRMIKHNKSKMRIYSIWRNMKHRCSSSAKGQERKDYYLRGIKVCPRWNFFNYLDANEFI